MKDSCMKEVEIALLRSELEHISKKVDEVHKAVVGNGKPGLTDRISSIEGGLKFSQFIFGAITLGILIMTVVN